MKIRKLKREGRGRVEWVLDYYQGGKRIRKWFKSKAAAEGEQQTINEQTRTSGTGWVNLDPTERTDVMLLVEEAKKEGVTLRQVWEAYRNGKLDAVPLQRCTFKDAIAETIKQRRADNLRDRYVRELENYLKKFAEGRTEMFVDQIGVTEINEWFEKRGEAISTRKSNVGRLGSMFDVCWRRGFIPENPALKVTLPKEDKEPPKILSPDQAKAMLKACKGVRRRMLPWLVLGLWQAVRPEELTKLRYRHLNLKDGTLHLPAGVAKTRNARTIPLVHSRKVIRGGKELIETTTVVLDWLRKFKPGKPDDLICPPKQAIKRARAKLKKAAGVEWSHDLCRHNAGSFLLKFYADPVKVSQIMGNSVRVLERHYKNVEISEAACAAFWQIKEVK